MSNPDYSSLHQFIINTPEGGLRKMLADPKTFTDSHFSLLIKVARAGDEASFVQCIEKGEFPKVKFSPGETKIKESFWADAIKTFQSRGLLGPIQKVA